METKGSSGSWVIPGPIPSSSEGREGVDLLLFWDIARVIGFWVFVWIVSTLS